MTQLTLISPETTELEVEKSSIVKRANDLTIASADEHAVALLMLKDVATAQRKVQELFKDPKAAAHAAHKSITEAEGKLLGPLAEARGIISRKATTYELEEQRKAEEEAKRLQEEARQAEEKRQIEDAILAEASGDKAQAEEILAAPVEVATVKPIPQIARMSGITSRTNYKGEVEDLLVLVKHVAANPHLIGLLEVNQTGLNAYAKAMKEGFKMPGCRLVKDVAKSVKVG